MGDEATGELHDAHRVGGHAVVAEGGAGTVFDCVFDGFQRGGVAEGSGKFAEVRSSETYCGVCVAGGVQL